MADRDLAFAMARITALKPREKLTLFNMVDRVSSLEEISRLDVETIIGRSLRKESWNPAELLAKGERDLNRCRDLSIRTTFYWDHDYPPQLREIFDPPFLLYYRGVLPDYSLPLVAVVGTRVPTGKAIASAFSLSFELGRLGIGVVSGLARGIDGKAHKGNIAGGGKSLAVLGSGPESFYPQSNSRLGRELLDSGGAVLSEYPPDTPPLKYHFPQRNRIISGLARSVVVIQAPEKSGALYTVDFALEQGRDIFVHRNGLAGREGAGTRALAESGAGEISSADELISDWGFSLGDRTPIKPFVSDRTGKNLAFLLEEELAGKSIPYKGEYFRRA